MNEFPSKPPSFIDDEKMVEIDPDTISAFGITLQSRYGKALEMAEMIQFATSLWNHDLHRAVESVFYDSKAQICFFEFYPFAVDDTSMMARIKDIADATITQFQFVDGCVYNKLDIFPEDDEPGKAHGHLRLVKPR